MERWAAKKGEMWAKKKNPHFTEKVGILKEKKSGREVGILRKSHFFPKMSTLSHKKSEYGKKSHTF